MSQLLELLCIVLVVAFASILAAAGCQVEKHATVVIKGFKYAEALLELTDPAIRHSHSDIPLLFMGTIEEINEAASSSILEGIRDAKHSDEDRSIDVGLVLERKWIRSQGRNPDWPKIIHSIRKEFKQLTGFSLRAIQIIDGKGPIELVHAVESTRLALLVPSKMEAAVKLRSVRRKSKRRKLVKKIARTARKASIIEFTFRRHPQSAHLKAIKRAIRKLDRELVDVSTCLQARPSRNEIVVAAPSRSSIVANY